MNQISTRITEFNNLSDDSKLIDCFNRFIPFVFRKINNQSLNLDILLNCDAVVDISCVNEEESSNQIEFKGNSKDRDLIYLEIKKFYEGFLFRRNGKSHWLDSTKIKLYLSQQVIYSCDKSLSIPKELGNLQKKLYIV